MRPGPGLVVMALAFISGARRASTSSSSSSSLITTTTTTIRTLTTTTTTPPAITPATTTTPAASRSAAATLPSSYDSRESLNFINAGGGFSFFQLPKVLDGSPGDVPGRRPSSSERSPAHNLPLNFDFYRRPALHAPDESFSSSSSSTRRVRSLDEGTRSASSHDAAQSTESAAGAPESSEATLINEEAETEPEQEPVEEQAEQEEEEVNSGLPVQYTSSRAFDADAGADVVADEDIFALVAEDDLLSEESFDRLIKLNEEVDEDYNLDASLALTQTQQQQPQQQPQHPKDQQQEQEPESQQQDEIRLVDESVLHAQLNEKDTEVEDTNNNNNNKRETGEEGKSSGHDAYASHLIAIAQRDGGTSAATVATATPIKTSTTTTGATPVVDLKKSILGTATALTRLNPWISACDLAQPGTTGTDLQGQCSAGTLPMAWVDEGPGPPICPRSCAEQQPTTDSARNADNKLKYFINANRFNYKTRLSHHSNNNNMNIMKAMSRMRRDAATTEEEEEEATTTTTATATTTEQELEIETMEASTLATTKAKDDVELDEQSLPTLPLHYSHLQTQEQLNIDEEKQQQQQQQEEEEQLQQQQQQQQQCLDYLGDAAETSPQHLCGMRSPGQLLLRLRTLRLRHCCERSVFSALHTLALNATLTDRDECVRLLSDLLDVDALANRITCELAEILFRFDCRQVYSLVHQCDDCKEAYRRWVCSALVPYFAEPQDVDATSPPPSSTAPPSSTKATPKPKHVDDLPMTRGSTSKPTATAASKSKRAARNAAGSDGISINIKHKSQKLISNNNKSNNGNNMNERQINQQHDEHNEPQNKNANVNVVNVAQAFYNVVGIGQHQLQTQSQSQFHSQSQFKNNNRKDTRRGAISGPDEQFNNFISTANNADPSAADPVISKLQKRSTCKAEFRKRRRIRPCLSVCQTVEQKCPYLLPADRAPALPTQYAGEPTFSCLDQNIPETGEQLKKSSYGPNDCCYSYCNGPTEGLCTICKDFASTSGRNGTSSSSSSSTSNSGGEHRVHNITLTMSSPPGEHARAASVSVALRNVTTAPSGGEELLLERLPYYARHDSVYYYDDDEDEGSDMPDMALSGGCAAVPSVSTRCTIPYYASGVAPSPPTQLLVWLSALLGLLGSCGAARQRCASRAATANSRPPSGRGPNCAASCHELLASSGQERQRETLHSRDAVGNGSASFTASCQTWACNWAWKWAWQSMGTTWPVNNTYKVTCRKKVRYFRGSSRSKLKVKVDGIDAMMSSTRDIPDTSRIINFRDLRQLIRVRIKCSDLARNRNDRNYRYFYYYNYNINDWWRRWKWFMMQQGTIAIGAL